MIKKLPYPIAGLMLALAALGNLLKPYGETLRLTLGALSFLLLILLIYKIIKMPKTLLEAFSQPPVAGVLATLPMGIMILSTYANVFHKMLGATLWWVGIGIHVLFMVLFFQKTLFPYKIQKVFPSYFVMFVGIVCASVAAPAHGYKALGQLIFWFGLAAYLFWLPVVLYRVIKVKQIPVPAMPTLAIFAAPASLLLAGYHSSFEVKSSLVVHGLTTLSLFFYVCTLIYMVKGIRQKFVPSFSAFTFPFVISAVALKPFSTQMEWFKPLHVFMIGFAIFMVTYVLVGYLIFLFKKEPSNA